MSPSQRVRCTRPSPGRISERSLSSSAVHVPDSDPRLAALSTMPVAHERVPGSPLIVPDPHRPTAPWSPRCRVLWSSELCPPLLIGLHRHATTLRRRLSRKNNLVAARTGDWIPAQTHQPTSTCAGGLMSCGSYSADRDAGTELDDQLIQTDVFCRHRPYEVCGMVLTHVEHCSVDLQEQQG